MNYTKKSLGQNYLIDSNIISEQKKIQEEEYKRKRSIMAGPKKSVNDKDMKAIDMSIAENTGFGDLEAKRKEFLGGDDDDLKHLGFYDSDDEIDFSNFKIGSKTKSSST